MPPINGRPAYGRQLWALLRKNATLKRRSACAFVCQLITPILFSLVLVLGYSLSDVDLFPAGIYAQPSLSAELPLQLAGFSEPAAEEAEAAAPGLSLGAGNRRHLSVRSTERWLQYATATAESLANGDAVDWLLGGHNGNIWDRSLAPPARAAFDGAVGASDVARVGGRALADANTTALPSPTDRCPWVGADSGSEFHLQCMDGTVCQAKRNDESTNPGDWSCCSSTARGGRARCPRNTVMCADANDCASDTDHCCMADCSGRGGERPCDSPPTVWQRERESEDSTVDSDSFDTDDLYLARDQFQSFVEGPLPIPSFDVFVGAHLAISRSLDDRTLDQLKTYNRYARDFGNLLTLGTLHFAPDSPETRRCVDYFNRTTEMFRLLDVRLHKDEDAALNDVLSNSDNRRTWAVVVLDKASDGAVDYTLRLNYTTMPNTNRVVRWIARGLNKDFQRYYTSGFLTLQRKIDEFMFDRASPSPAAKAMSPRWRSGTTRIDRQGFSLNASTADGTRDAVSALLSGAASAGVTAMLQFARGQDNSGAQRDASRVYADSVAALDAAGAPWVSMPTNTPIFTNQSAEWLPPVVGVPMPTAAYSQNLFFSAAGFLIGMVMTMATAYPTAHLVKALVEEKESRIKELLLMAGLSPGVFYLSWFITALIPFTITAAGVTYVLTSSFVRYSDPSLVFVYVFLFFLSEIALGFFIAAFFSRAKLATYFAYVVVFVAMLPKYVFFGTNRYENPTGKMYTSLLSPSAFGFGADIIGDFENADRGVTWDNYNDGDFSFRHCLDFMFLDFFIYSTLAWYFNNVVQAQYGHSLPWYFPFMRSYWGSCTDTEISASNMEALPSVPYEQALRSAQTRWSTRRTQQAAGTRLLEEDPLTEEQVRASVRRDKDAPDLAVIISGLNKVFHPPTPTTCANIIPVICQRFLRRLWYAARALFGCPLRNISAADYVAEATAAYKSNKVHAVQDLNLGVYAGQVTCLLGHNGAGKSTTISMLTGLYPATSGSAWITDRSHSAHSISNGLRNARRLIGVCPQHSVIFPRLTVREHLQLFGELKGNDGRGSTTPLSDTIDALVTAVGLGAKRDTEAGALSGGMKRKLSVAIALIGNPRVVFLDEPTSGMDPHSRRAMWDLLRRSREGRALILTTHFMDEADLLGDRIGIMHGGALHCVGSSLFLKSRFGLGYTLSLIKSDRAEPSPEEQSISQLIRTHVPSAQVLNDSANELTYRLPLDAVASFEALFRELDLAKSSSNGIIDGYGISITTLEEVFLRLEKEAQARDAAAATVAAGAAADLPETVPLKILEDAEVLQAMDRDLDELDDTNTSPSAGRIVRRVAIDEHDQTKVVSADGAAVDAHVADLPRPSSRQHFIELLMKRVNIAKRDFKSFKFQIVMPVIVIALVLLILTIDVPLAGRRREMNTGLFYQPRRGYVDTQVLYSNSSGRMDSRGSTMIPHIDRTHARLEHITAEHLGATPSSAQLSMYMLRTWNDHNFDTRFGAFVFDDTIEWKIENVSKAAGILLNGTTPGDEGVNFFSVNASTAAKQLEPLVDYLVQQQISITDVLDAAGVSSVGASTQQLDISLSDAFFATINSTLGTPQAIFGNTTRSPIFLELTNETLVTEVKNDLINVTNNTWWGQWAADIIRDVNISSFIDAVNATESFLNESNSNFTVSPDASWQQRQTNVSFDLITVNAAQGTIIMENVILRSNLFGVQQDFSANLGRVVYQEPRDGRASTIQFVNGTTTQWGSVVLAEQTPYTLEFVNSSRAIFDAAVDFLTTDQSRNELARQLRNAPEHYMVSQFSPFTLLHNSSSAHSMPAFIGEVSRAQYRALTGRSDATYITRNRPLPLSVRQQARVDLILSVVASLLLLIPFCYIPAAFAVFIVRERTCKAKHLQMASGVSPWTYWASAFTFDYCQYIILIVWAIAVFELYGNAIFMSDVNSKVATVLLFFLYGLASLPLSYVYSFMFSNHSSAQIVILSINFFTGFVMVMANFIMRSLPKTRAAAYTLVYFYRFFPSYNFGEALINIADTYYRRKILGRTWAKYWSWRVMGRPLTLLALEFVFYSWLCIVIESDRWRAWHQRLQRYFAGLRVHCRKAVGLKPPHTLLEQELVQRGQDLVVEDDDVLREHAYVATIAENGVNAGGVDRNEQPVVVINELHKRYVSRESSRNGKRPGCLEVLGAYGPCGRGSPGHVAVRSLSLQIPHGQCFGFLGVNGAGKTTTLSILTGDIEPTKGDAWIAGRSVVDEMEQVQRNIGYCPQFDPLLELLTGRETIRMFALLKGVPRDSVDRLVDHYLDIVGLKRFSDRVAGSYSGGNKRKLSLAIALVGRPRVVMLDEPSTGMDPVARRQMWDIISAQSRNRCFILTTHAMEEAEALCSRIGIMVNGVLCCLGSSQHLKMKYGANYEAEFKVQAAGDLATQRARVDRLQRFMTETFPGAELEESHGTLLKYKMPKQGDISLSEAFGRIERAKGALDIADYSLTQATLEQIFVSFAKHQTSTEPDANLLDETEPTAGALMSNAMSPNHDASVSRQARPVSASQVRVLPVSPDVDIFPPAPDNPIQAALVSADAYPPPSIAAQEQELQLREPASGEV